MKNMNTTLFYNGVCHSMRSEDDVFAAFSVCGGRIVSTYTAAQSSALRPSDYGEAVDLKGRHVYPCLIDGHSHMLMTIASMATGFNACEIRSEGVTPHTLSEVGQRIRSYARGKKKNAVIAVNKYICAAMDEQRMPSREELDDWGGGRAMVVYNIDGHSCSLSSAMLLRIGIDPGGHSGVLTGEESERVQGRLIDICAGAITLRELARGIAAFHNACAAYGIGVVAALEGNGDSRRDTTTRFIIRLARHFDVGVRLYLQYTDLSRVAPFAGLMKHKRLGGCGDWEMDGAVGSHSAAFFRDYIDTGVTAPCYLEQERVDSLCAQAERQGYQIAAHAIGTAAIDRLITAYEKLDNRLLHRIEHGEFTDEDTFRRISRGGWAVMAQPGYSWIDKRYLHSYEKALPSEILSQMRLKSFYDAGVPICGSSDSPVQDLDPYLQMQGMTEFFVESESLSPYQALTTYTVNAAKAILEYDQRATLESGKAADFFTADMDFSTLKPGEVIDFRPVQTYYGGRAYKKKCGSIFELLCMLLKKPKKI